MNNNFQVGQWVRVVPHTTYSNLEGGAVSSFMREHQHNGFHKAQIESIFIDGGVEIFVPGYGIDVVDISYLETL